MVFALQFVESSFQIDISLSQQVLSVIVGKGSINMYCNHMKV